MITDYEYRYRISGGSFVAPIQCTTENSVDNGDGTITITDIPNENIAAGDFQVRTRAINGNAASSWLVSDADFPVSVPTPTNPILNDEEGTFTFTI